MWMQCGTHLPVPPPRPVLLPVPPGKQPPWFRVHCLTVSLTPPFISHSCSLCSSEDFETRDPRDPAHVEAPATQAAPTFTNILLPWAAWLGPLCVQYTDIDFRSRENSRVNSFRIS